MMQMEVMYLPQDAYNEHIKSEENWIKNNFQNDIISVDDLISVYRSIAMNVPNRYFKKPVANNVFIEENFEYEEYNALVNIFKLLLEYNFFMISNNDQALVKTHDMTDTGSIFLCVPNKQLDQYERKVNFIHSYSNFNIIGLAPSFGSF